MAKARDMTSNVSKKVEGALDLHHPGLVSMGHERFDCKTTKVR